MAIQSSAKQIFMNTVTILMQMSLYKKFKENRSFNNTKKFNKHEAVCFIKTGKTMHDAVLHSLCHMWFWIISSSRLALHSITVLLGICAHCLQEIVFLCAGAE